MVSLLNQAAEHGCEPSLLADQARLYSLLQSTNHFLCIFLCNYALHANITKFSFKHALRVHACRNDAQNLFLACTQMMVHNKLRKNYANNACGSRQSNECRLVQSNVSIRERKNCHNFCKMQQFVSIIQFVARDICVGDQFFPYRHVIIFKQKHSMIIRIRINDN